MFSGYTTRTNSGRAPRTCTGLILFPKQAARCLALSPLESEVSLPCTVRGSDEGATRALVQGRSRRSSLAELRSVENLLLLALYRARERRRSPRALVQGARGRRGAVFP